MPTFRVPASTTNLSHGFDCLGMALGLHNTVTVEPGGNAVTAPGAADPGLAVLAERMRARCAQTWGRPLPGFTVTVQGNVPIARGMGSSSTILLAVAAACQQLASRPVSHQELIELTAEVEGHPDNVAAACLGGFTVVGRLGGHLRCSRFAVPVGLMAIAVIPPYEVKTSEARAVLPQQLSRAEHVTGIQGTALIVAALARGDGEALRGLFAHGWHEGHRAPLNPELSGIRSLAEDAGALGTILSGSGSTLLIFVAEPECAAIHSRITSRLHETSPRSLCKPIAFDNEGLRTISG